MIETKIIFFFCLSNFVNTNRLSFSQYLRPIAPCRLLNSNIITSIVTYPVVFA